MEVILHIGTEKTGTTSVQRFFRLNRARLAERGILYPVAPGNQSHAGIPVSAQAFSKRGPLRRSVGVRNESDARAYREQLWQELGAEFAARPYRMAVLSSEHCSSRLQEESELRWLKESLSHLAGRIRIVVYIRRQDDYLLSTFSTSIKSGSTKPLAWPAERLMHDRYDHHRLLERWSAVFGRENVVCRKFERASLKDGDVVADFLEVAGIEAGPQFEQPEEVNEALDAETLEFLRLLNKHVPRFNGKKLNPLRDNLVPLLSKASRGALLTLDQAELARFMAQFDESNAKVARDWFGGVLSGSDNPLFAPRSDKRERVSAAALTPERAVELCAMLWQEKQAQLGRVAAKLRAAGDGPALRKKGRGAGQKRFRRAGARLPPASKGK